MIILLRKPAILERYTVEPLIKDPPRKGQLLHKGTLPQCPQKCIFQLPKRGQPPYNMDQMAGPKVSFTRTEVPLSVLILQYEFLHEHWVYGDEQYVIKN